MITKDFVVKIKKDETKLNGMPYVYQGDKGIVFEMTLDNWKYFFSQATGIEEDQLVDCQARILLFNPNGEQIKLTDVPIKNNEVNFIINQNLTKVAGDYITYIQIFKESGATVTCPPFIFTVKELKNFDEVLPSDKGIIKIQDNNALAYDSPSAIGTKLISQLPKITNATGENYIILQVNDITHIIKVSDFLRDIENELNNSSGNKFQELKKYADDKLVEGKGYTDTKLTEGKGYADAEIVKAKAYTDTKTVEAKGYTDTKVSELVGSAPETLDTIHEIATALKGDANIVDTLTTEISKKAEKVHTHTKSEITDLFTVENDFTSNSTDNAISVSKAKEIDDKVNTLRDEYDVTKNTVDNKLDELSISTSNELVANANGIEKYRLPLPKGFDGKYTSLTDVPKDFTPSKHTHKVADIDDMIVVEDNLVSESTVNALSAAKGKELNTKLENKVDKIDGKQLSSEDFTSEEKQKLKDLKNYSLPVSSKDVLGGVKIGAGFSITQDGIISVSSGGTADAVAWENVLGKPESYPPSIHKHTISEIEDYKQTIIINDLLTGGIDSALSAEQGKELNKLLSNKVDKSGNKQLSTEDFTSEEKQKLKDLKNYSLPIASETSLGGIKIGKGMSISEDGTVNIESAGVVVNWGNLNGKPETFPPSAHTHVKTDITDLSIIDNLTTTDSNNPLSANQGKLLKDDISSINNRLDSLNSSGNHVHSNKEELDKITTGKVAEWDAKETTIGSQEKATQAETNANKYTDEKLIEAKNYTDTELNGMNGYADGKLVEAKSYTDSKITSLVGAAPEALDTIHELASALSENKDTVGVLTTQISGKAEKVHTHNMSDIKDLFKVENSLTSNSTTNAASVSQVKSINDKVSVLEGNVEIWNNKADGNHTHNLDNLTEGNTNKFVTQGEKDIWNNSSRISDETVSKTSTWSSDKIKKELTNNGVLESAYKTMTISEWTLDNDTQLYKSTVLHNMNTEDLIIEAYNSTTKSNELISYRIIDVNTLEVMAEDNQSIDLKILGGAVKKVDISVPEGGGTTEKKEIDDSQESLVTTWSSTKIKQEISKHKPTPEGYSQLLQDVSNLKQNFGILQSEVNGAKESLVNSYNAIVDTL